MQVRQDGNLAPVGFLGKGVAPAAAAQPGLDVGQTHLAVVGGGLVGVATAWGLAREGCRVVVLDEGGTRELRRDGQTWLVRERTSATTLQVRNRADGYDLTIESVAGGVHEP